MPDYKRWFCDGGTYFFTIVTYNRRKIFCDAHGRTFLHRAMAEVQASHPFEMLGVVLLPAIWIISTTIR